MAENKLITAEEAGKVADKNDLEDVMLLIRGALDQKEYVVRSVYLRKATIKWLENNGYSVRQSVMQGDKFDITW